jgi:hypothetical protein
VPGAEAEPIRIVQRVHGREDPVEVEQWLAIPMNTTLVRRRPSAARRRAAARTWSTISAVSRVPA